MACVGKPAKRESEAMQREPLDSLDRLAVRARPSGWPIMYQSWGRLLFLHWPLPEESLRPLIPDPLVIDTFGGSAWIGITPFTMWGVRPAFLPPVPVLSESHELNVRTYVHLDGVPGIWFFSLDASNSIAAIAARLTFHLPYFNARMSFERRDRTLRFVSERKHPRAAPAEFDAVWSVGRRLPRSEPGSLEFFLTERYVLYSARRDALYRARILHRPWPLHEARLLSCRSTMIGAQGLPPPGGGEPLLHQQGEPLRVRVWPRIRVREHLPSRRDRQHRVLCPGLSLRSQGGQSRQCRAYGQPSLCHRVCIEPGREASRKRPPAQIPLDPVVVLHRPEEVVRGSLGLGLVRFLPPVPRVYHESVHQARRETLSQEQGLAGAPHHEVAGRPLGGVENGVGDDAGRVDRR